MRVIDVIFSGLIILSLYVVSGLFDEYIDKQDVNELYDGQTAVWVAIGCSYTILGFGLIMGIWYGWQEGAVSMGLLFACFVASGLPMYMGDASRNRNERRK